MTLKTAMVSLSCSGLTFKCVFFINLNYYVEVPWLSCYAIWSVDSSRCPDGNAEDAFNVDVEMYTTGIGWDS